MRLLPFTVHNATSIRGIQLPSTIDNFSQHLLHHNTSFIAFSMNELKIEIFRVRPLRRRHSSLGRKKLFPLLLTENFYSFFPCKYKESLSASHLRVKSSDLFWSLATLISALVHEIRSRSRQTDHMLFSLHNKPSISKATRLFSLTIKDERLLL